MASVDKVAKKPGDTSFSTRGSPSMDDTPTRPKVAAAGNGAPNGQRRAARAELVWEGKYDAAGRRVAPLRIPLPFQTVETVNESAQDRQRRLAFGPGFREEEWRNRLIWGDKKYVLPSLLSEFAGKVNLIYIDPPFDTGADFSFTATVPDSPESEEDNIRGGCACLDSFSASISGTPAGFKLPSGRAAR